MGCFCRNVFRTHFLKSGASKRGKGWTFLKSGEFTDSLEIHVIARKQLKWILQNMGPLNKSPKVQVLGKWSLFDGCKTALFGIKAFALRVLQVFTWKKETRVCREIYLSQGEILLSHENVSAISLNISFIRQKRGIMFSTIMNVSVRQHQLNVHPSSFHGNLSPWRHEGVSLCYQSQQRLRLIPPDPIYLWNDATQLSVMR